MTEQELKENLKNKKWRLNNLYFIKDEKGNRIKFKLNWAQNYLLDNLWYLNIILKARQLGVCLDPNTKVLTADLKWVKISELKIGTELISVDEYPKGGRWKARKMRTGIVQGVVEVDRQAYRITFDDGRCVICTGQHPWLSKKTNTQAQWRNIDGIGNSNKKARLVVGTKIRSITKPWENDKDYEDGWFGGMIDGEGSFSNKRRYGAQVGVAQIAGDVFDRMKKYCEDRNYNYRIEIDKRKAGESSKLGNKYVYKIIVGRINELFKLCGQTRPSRFIKKKWWEEKELPTNEAWNTIVKIKKLGKQKMIDLQTSEGTYIAEGFVSHNTTFFCITYLDDVVFKGYDAGLIAHTIDDAKKIFDTKIKYAWDNMPNALKNEYSVDKDTARELKFKRGEIVSSIYVGTSLRSQTVQRLHISELGTLDQKYPQKAIEIQSGALNTVHKGQTVTIESTAKGQNGVLFDMCKQAMDSLRSKAELTEMDYKFFFFPWYKHPAYKLSGDIVIPKELKEYFKKLEIEEGVELTQEQKNWYFKKKSTQKEQMRTEFPSTPAEAFQANIEGAYFGKQMDKAMEQNRICKVPFDPLLKVETWWDLGTDNKRSDSMAIIFTQTHGLEIRIIDYYGNHGEGLPHYFRILQEKAENLGYLYERHNAPHDIEVKEIGTGKTRLETARSLGIYFNVLPKIGFLDSIEATRNLLAKCWFDEEMTAKLIRALKSFRKEWDDKLGKFKDTPLKDWSSDPSDAFRMLGIGHRGSYLARYTNKEEEEFFKEKEGFDPNNPFPEIN